MNRRSVRTTLAGAALSLTVMVSGCMSGGIQSIPLPGGVDTGSSPRTYKIQFDDVLDLVPQSMVKRDGIPVGRVTKVEVPNDAWFAQVTVEVQNDVDLSDEAQASVQQTSLLGEKFVSLSDPDNSANAPRQNPAEPIPVDRTRTATDIEQVLGALALLLTGGGINQLQPIVSELNKTLGGRTDEVRSLIDQTEKLIAGLNRQRDDIVAAIDGLADLSARTEKQTAQIDRILKQLPPEASRCSRNSDRSSSTC